MVLVGALLFYMLASVGGAVWVVLRGIRNEVNAPVTLPKPGQHINVLFLGLDAVVHPSTGKVDLNAPLRSSRGRSDTMILISVDPDTNRAALISIPRDTRALIPGRGPEKVNHAHAYGGPALAMRTVEQLLGIVVHYYVRTNYHGVQAVVDTLGGVTIDVEKDMKYEDPLQDLVIDLKKGRQLLDGDKALQYLRYRNGGGDIARIGRQQQFIGAVIREAMTFGTVFRAQALAREVVKYIDTNMSAGQILEYALLLSRISDPSVEMATLPGSVRNLTDPGVGTLSYWVLDEAGTADIVDRLVWGIDKTANSGTRVRVLNGTGTSGLATEMAAKLRKDGFNVIGVANAPSSNYERTTVLAHVPDQAVSDRVVRSVMRYASDPATLRELLREPPCDVTVIVGRDFVIAAK
jgi:LCP family protein required for cell wall assembly